MELLIQVRVLIYNFSSFNPTNKSNLQSKIIVSIGKLDPQKGFDLLIEAWQGVDAELEILGDGEDFEKLSRLIEKYKLQDRVKLIGFV